MKRRSILRFLRLISIVLVAALGTSVLMYCSPGYFADSREMDGMHATAARTDLDQLHTEQGTLGRVLLHQIHAWLKGDLGQSRQYGVPVSSLLRERAARSARLLASGVLAGWLLSLALAILLSLRRDRWTNTLVAVSTALLLSFPVGVLATFCVVSNLGGPAFVLALVVATRDFKVLYRTLQDVWTAPYLLYAQAQGMTRRHILRLHIIAVVRRELTSLALLSFTLALSVLVPLEVVFDVPGLGQLAWAAAVNRDLPVLVAITGLMAACVGLAGLFLDSSRVPEAPQCA